jgi:FYVE zinc finger
VSFHELKHCEICEQVFNLTIRRHHCRKCGKSVCNKCSANMKALSRQDAKTTLYRICDKCDTEMENFKLKKNHDEIIKA